MKRYRVVTDDRAGYEVQVKEFWFFPWIDVGLFGNTFRSQEEAICFIAKIKEYDAKMPTSGRVVYEE